MHFSKKIIIALTLFMAFILSLVALSAPTPLSLHFLDVGNADCILVHTPGGHNMLIDAGNNNDANTITSYLSSQAVAKIDVLVVTHPHKDHIGSMDTVIRKYPIRRMYMPKVTTPTKTFANLSSAIQSKRLKVQAPVPGSFIALDPALRVKILAPHSSKYEDINNYSIVLKITYDKTSFLLAGDAKRQSEQEMVVKYRSDLKADVLKVGHHGDKSSTTAPFLKAVAPQYAIISVGKNNEFSHLKKGTLNRLERNGVKVYRTDLNGTIVATSDGKTINVSAEK